MVSFSALVESVIKLGLAPVLLLYMVWYFTRQFDRLVAANERISRAVVRIALHLDLDLEDEEEGNGGEKTTKKPVNIPVFRKGEA